MPDSKSPGILGLRSRRAALLVAAIAAGLVIIIVVIVVGGSGAQSTEPARMLRKLKLSTPETLPPADQPVVPVSGGKVDRAATPSPANPDQQASSTAEQFSALQGPAQSVEWFPPPGTQDPFSTRAVRLTMRLGADAQDRVSGWWSYSDSQGRLRVIEDALVTIVGRNSDGSYTVGVKLFVWKFDMSGYDGTKDIGQQTLTTAP